MNKMKKILLLLTIVCLFSSPVFAETTNRIDMPIGYYPNPDKSGAIGLGELYIGDVDTDPTVVGNQKQVSIPVQGGGSVAISQPIALSAGGVPTYLGNPVTLYVDGDYSLTVLDSFDAQIYYISDSDPFPDNATIVDITDFGALCDKGVTDDTIAIQAAIDSLELVTSSPVTYRRGWVLFPEGACRITDTITVPSGVSLIGERAVSPYSDGLSEHFGSVIVIDKITAGAAVHVVGSNLDGTNGSIEHIGFVGAEDIWRTGPFTDLGAIYLDDTFMFQIRNCTFNKIDGDFAIRDGGHGTQITNCIITRIGDAQPDASDWANDVPNKRADYYTAGIGIDQDTEPGFDGQYANNFIEKCGTYGAKIKNNTKMTGNFIDLCGNGVWVEGERVVLTGNSIKWNMNHGVWVEEGEDLEITGGVITGNNYYSYDNTTSAGYGIRFADNETSAIVTGVSFVDDYESNVTQSLYKSKRQIDIHAGPDGTMALISNCYFSDPDTGISGYTAIFDPQDNLGDRTVRLLNDYFEDGYYTAANENTSVSDYMLVSAGEWTATMTAGSGTVTLEALQDTLAWTREGLKVSFSGQLTVASVSTPGGALRITGLPFPVASLTEDADIVPVSLFVNGLLSSVNILQARVAQGGTTIIIVEFNGQISVDDVADKMQATTTIAVSGSYITSD